ncbi:Zn-dependent hydrolase [Amycolatopsis sp. cg5]|uniref:Zn-dependent hydrolase n=1 Tax=Amycolatopsis sp. cg5 TaxID=3238802 RepID=UPI0035265895
MSSLRISPQRLLNDLAELATFGGRDDGGVDRIAGSPADLASRTWLANRITSAGLESWTDPIGNVFGKQRGSRGPWLLTGSHTDTVPAAGRLDGAYGALAAIEVLRTLHEAGHPSAAALQTVAFWDEEGVLPTSNGGLVGSTALSVSEHIKEITGYVELHIEQGPRMEDAGLELAVVDGIVGVDRYLLVIRGEANHAGTTPMINRHDAGRAASKIAAHLWETADEVDETMVVNVGAMEFHPGVPNVVPGEAHLTVEFRAASEFALLAAGDRTLALTRRIGREQKCSVEVSRLSHKPVVRFDESYVDLIHETCVRQGVPTGRLVSFAGHDASVISSKVPTAMLFVPSTGGISHSPAEHTDDEYLVQGAQVLLETLVKIEQTLPKPVYLH